MIAAEEIARRATEEGLPVKRCADCASRWVALRCVIAEAIKIAQVWCASRRSAIVCQSVSTPSTTDQVEEGGRLLDWSLAGLSRKVR